MTEKLTIQTVKEGLQELLTMRFNPKSAYTNGLSACIYGLDEGVAELASRPDVVEDILPASGKHWLFGAPGSLKTFMLLDIAAAVASGKPWAGRKVQQGRVLYLFNEGGFDLHLRAKAAAEEYGLQNADKRLSLIPAPVSLDQQEGLDFIRKLQKADQRIKKAVHDFMTETLVSLQGKDAIVVDDEGRELDYTDAEYLLEMMDLPELSEPVRLIILDNYTCLSSGSDTKTDVTAFYKAMDELVRAFPDAAVMVADHSQKASDKEYLGSIGKHARTDVFTNVRRADDVATMYSIKTKFTDEFKPIHRRAIKKEVAFWDYEADKQAARTTLVLVDGETAAERQKAGRGGKTSLVLDLLTEPLSRDDLRDKYLALDHGTNKPASTKRTFRAILGGLIESGIVIEDEDEILTLAE